MQLYVSKNGQRYGPYSLEELRQAVLARVFRPEDFASRDSGCTWEPISAVPGIGPLVYSVAVDPGENLLRIRYRGRVRASAVAQCAEEVGRALSHLQAGFRLLVDFTEMESMEVECARELERIMQLCDDREVQTVVRVIPHPERDIGLSIMSYFHYGPQVQIATFGTLAEAETILTRSNEFPVSPGFSRSSSTER